jgi:hypothetical protein
LAAKLILFHYSRAGNLIYLRQKLKRPFVYLVRKRAIGDVLWIEPLIRQLALRAKKVVVYTKYPELFLNYPLTNVRFTNRLSTIEKAIWALQKAFGFWHIFIDLDGAYEQAAGLPCTREYPRLYLSEEERAFRPAEAGDGKYIVLHLESLTDRNYRKVYGIDWEKVVAAHKQKGYTTILIGKSPERIPGAIVVRTSVREMMGVIRNAAFFIGIDSGPSHLAAALGVPALIFFGAVNSDFRHFKDLLKGRILQQPCEHFGWYHEANAETGWSCRLVGDEGIPKCSMHSTEYVLNNIDLLLKEQGL